MPRNAVLMATLIGVGACVDGQPQPASPFSASGELIALSGADSGAANACFTCHGLDGGGDGDGAPRLAGLDLGYLNRQLDDYSTGRRQHPQMEYIARRLGAAERQAVAAHYAAMPSPLPPETAPAPAPPAMLYVVGDPARGLPACGACHGRSGEGVGLGVPPLAGQPAPYIEAQLHAWRAGKRRNDPENVMLRISRRLTPDEIRSVAAHASALPGASPRPESPEASP